MPKPHQIQLFDTVCRAYGEAGDGELTQDDLYRAVERKLGISEAEISAMGKSCGRTFNIFKRNCRWAQQQMKAAGLLERVDRGVWTLTRSGKDKLTEMSDGFACLAFCTELGVALWADAKHVGAEVIEGPINLILTSPPYFRIQRNYGTYTCEKSYVDFIVSTLEPFVAKMAPGAGVVLNVGNDVFNAGEPTRSVYVERLTLALHDALGLSLVERVVWQTNKCPGPTQYAFVQRMMLRSGFEFALCFTNDPSQIRWDNRRVLEDQDEKYLAWCQAGGQSDVWKNSTYYKKKGAFSGTTEKRSKIPSNVLRIGNMCGEGRAVKAFARQHGLPEHTAMFPKMLAEFFIKWMTVAGDMVVDPFGGTCTTASSSESLGRRWLTCDKILEFLQCGSARFTNAVFNPTLQWPQAR